ncbi:MAG: alpha/beta fold hydrolase [Brumimicrobium sp.]
MRKLNWKTLAIVCLFITNISFAQKERDVKVPLGDEFLYGTFLKVRKKDAPVAIIIPGSGPTDRNGNSPTGIKAKTYQLMAEELAKQGISSLRYDKLAIGESVSKVEEKDMLFDDNVEQVEAWISFLQKKKYDKIILIGHSEGSLIGLLTANKNEAISKFISIAGIGRTIDEVLAEQLSNLPAELYQQSEQILYELKNGDTVDEVPIQLASVFRESVQPYLISFFAKNPTEEISKLDIPILIIQGTTDIQTTVDDAKMLKEANENAQLIIIEGMNHILKTAPEERDENIKTYYNPDLPLHQELIPKIVKFILE